MPLRFEGTTRNRLELAAHSLGVGNSLGRFPSPVQVSTTLGIQRVKFQRHGGALLPSGGIGMVTCLVGAAVGEGALGRPRGVWSRANAIDCYPREFDGSGGSGHPMKELDRSAEAAQESRCRLSAMEKLSVCWAGDIAIAALRYKDAAWRKHRGNGPELGEGAVDGVD